jgi:hypothetical protein
MKKCSTSLDIKERQVKTTLRFHFNPVRMTTIKNTNNNKCWQDVWKWRECKLVQLLWKKVSKVLKKLKLELPYDPAIPLLGIYPKECKSGYNRSTCTPMFIAELFTIVKLWKSQYAPY